MEPAAPKKRIVDKGGQPFHLGLCPPSDASFLLDMYQAFTPKKLHQGLPPEKPEALSDWIEGLMKMADNFTVWENERVVGHSALISDPARRDAEFIIFVLEPFRGRGLGSELTHAAIEAARDMDLVVIWLTVEAHNFRAIRLYRKYGFLFADDGGWERIMTLKLV
jgi:RimJ/RimL family protein N-acetyltransferase